MDAKAEFPVCPKPDDPSQCYVYRKLDFPKDVYDRINQFHLVRGEGAPGK